MERTKLHNSLYASSLIEASLDPLTVISPDGLITDMNQAKVNITGIKREKLIGTKFIDYFTEPQKAIELYKEIFVKGSVSNTALTFKHKNKKLTDVILNGSVYKDEKGNILGAVLVARDISKQKWAEEIRNANKELAFQNVEKEKRAAELILANKELIFQNKEKEKRASELILANKELKFQNKEKEKRAAELIVANKELVFQNKEKVKRASELVIANKELAFQNEEKEKRAAELILANEELIFQNKEKEKRASELILANKELIFQNKEKAKRASELILANKELKFQNKEKEKRAAELVVANKELIFQNKEKAKRASELILANKELKFQNKEKAKRATELIIADKELVYQIREKEKQSVVNIELEAISHSLKIASQYSLSLIEASRDPLFTVSPEGKITDINEATVKVTGIAREKIIGTDFVEYFTKPDKAGECYKQVFAKEFVVDFPLTIMDGKFTDVLCNGSVYKDGIGNVQGVVIVARDITEQKRIEKELLESIVIAELATDIAEDAKLKAETAAEIAENAVKAKQQFLSNMSHEIRTPMNAIIGFTKVVLKTDLSAKQKEYLTAIKMSGDSLIVLINDILDLAKVDAGKMTFEQVPFKMELSISAMLHLFETKIQEKNLELVKEYDHKIPKVLVGDPVRLHQIIINLVSNAVKFTSHGKITVSVRLMKEDKEKVTIKFGVADTGIGIAKDKIKHIFENFQQATSGTSRLYGGTGLGLSIVKHLVESQGGVVTVKSKFDEGSTFSFTLDFLKTTENAAFEERIDELDTGIKNIKVLVAEDIPLNQLLMKTLLDDFGFERDIAENGKIAIEKLESKSYDIVLMDLQMPEMNGFETTDYIRNKMHSKIPIIALTADVTTVDLAKCKAVGMNDYIAKPIDEKLLYHKIMSLVKKPGLGKFYDEKAKGPVASKKHKCINLDHLYYSTKSNPKLIMEMISLYLEQTPRLISAMKQSLKDNDWNTLYSAAHKMIPSFSIVGISSDFEEMAKKVQEYAHTRMQVTKIPEMVSQITDVCEQACAELEEEYNRIKKQQNE